MSPWWRLFSELRQQGPGSDESTRYALRHLPPLPASPLVLDMGCGTGRQTRVLAAETGGRVVALDLLAPFLEQLVSIDLKAGLGQRIRPVRADMGRPPFATGRFDLVWSEGAIYIPGFEEGLSQWRELLTDEGLAAVSELSWIAEPPAETRAFWEAEYPAVADVATNCGRAERAGYRVLSTFELPRSDWDAYYGPIEEKASTLREEYQDDDDALSILAGHHEEVGILERSEGSYTYVFYLLRKR